MALRKYGEIWYSYFRDEKGKLHTLSTSLTDREEAEKWDRRNMYAIRTRRAAIRLIEANPELAESAKKAEAEAMIPADQRKAHRRGTVRLEDMFKLAQSFHPNLKRRNETRWRDFCKRCGCAFADQVTPRIALEYLTNSCAGRTAKTWNNVKGELNAVFKPCLVAAGMEVSPFDPVAGKQMVASGVNSHRNLTDGEIEKLMASPSPLFVKVMVMLSRWTAQRLETCAKMSFAEFDFKKKVYLKQPGKTARFNKWVCVPLFPRLEEYLRSIQPQIADANIPIVMNFGYKNDAAFSRRFSLILCDLGINSDERGKASFHSLRGSAITWMKESGIPEEIRHDITGHTTKAVEDVYARAISNVSKVAREWK